MTVAVTLHIDRHRQATDMRRVCLEMDVKSGHRAAQTLGTYSQIVDFVYNIYLNPGDFRIGMPYSERIVWKLRRASTQRSVVVREIRMDVKVSRPRPTACSSWSTILNLRLGLRWPMAMRTEVEPSSITAPIGLMDPCGISMLSVWS